jgi:hypothetical protein
MQNGNGYFCPFMEFPTMIIQFDPEKRDKTLEHRGLDFEDAAQVLSGL